VDEYAITDSGGLEILRTALEAFDVMRAAQAVVKAEGSVTKDRFGQPKVHPAALVERDARGQYLAALKSLNLDLEPLRNGPGRPAGR
jgi:hypothetical protein